MFARFNKLLHLFPIIEAKYTEMRGDSSLFHSTVLYIFDITFSIWCLYSEVVLCCIADKDNYFPGLSIRTLLHCTQCDATERLMKRVSMIKQFYGTLNVYNVFKCLFYTTKVYKMYKTVPKDTWRFACTVKQIHILARPAATWVVWAVNQWILNGWRSISAP